MQLQQARGAQSHRKKNEITHLVWRMGSGRGGGRERAGLATAGLEDGLEEGLGSCKAAAGRGARAAGRRRRTGCVLMLLYRSRRLRASLHYHLLLGLLGLLSRHIYTFCLAAVMDVGCWCDGGRGTSEQARMAPCLRSLHKNTYLRAGSIKCHFESPRVRCRVSKVRLPGSPGEPDSLNLAEAVRHSVSESS